MNEVHAPQVLVNMLFSISPERIKILTRDEEELLIPAKDPVYDEKIVARSAARYGISSIEYRRRDAKTSQCNEEYVYRRLTVEQPPDLKGLENCINATSWNLSVPEYLARLLIARQVCLEKKLVPNDKNFPGTDDKAACHRYFLAGSHL